MNQELKHGMKVRAKQDIYGANSGDKMASKGDVQVLAERYGHLCFGGFAILGPCVADCTNFFEIIPELKARVEELESQVPQWRCPEDDPPAVFQAVMVCFPSPSVDDGFYFVDVAPSYLAGGEFHFINSGDDIHGVLGWMDYPVALPLPSHLKEGA